MGYTSPAVKTRWNEKNYDKIGFTIPKGLREEIKDYASRQGMTVNQLINMLLRDEIGILKVEWGFAVGYNPYMNKESA